MGLGLVALILIAFAPAWRAGFIWDDDTYVIDNPLMTEAHGWWRIWFSLDSTSQYFPLTFTLLRLERQLWGLHPMGYHVVNIFLHAANALLVWRLLARLRVPGAWLGAALFALHPVQVESVAWIAECKNVLMGLFFLTALHTWISFIDTGSERARYYYAAALTGQALALFAKTTACTLPAALLLVLWWKERPIDRKRVIQVVPFFLLAFLMGLLTVWWEKFHQGTEGTVFNMSILARCLVASHALWFYLGKLIWPANLAFSYPRWTVSVNDPTAYLWLAATMLAAWLIWLGRRRTGRGPAVAGIFFATTLSPVLGFIMLYTFVYTFVADHYQYLACIGPLALAGAVFSSALRRAQIKFLGPAAYSLLLLTLSLLTWRQCETYYNLETLWRATIAHNPTSWLALNDLGALLYNRGETTEAIGYLRRSLAVQPGNAETHNNLAVALDKEGRGDEALDEFRQALICRPAFAEAHRNMGDLLLRRGDVDDALEHFRAAVQLRPDIARARFNLASTLSAKGLVDEAVANYRAALKSDPTNADGHYDLGVLLLQHGQNEAAEAEFRTALNIRPAFLEAQNNLAFALVREGKLDEAIALLRLALANHPDYAQAHYNLGNALLQKGLTDEAILEFRKLVALQPNAVEPHRILARALRKNGNAAEAAEQEKITAGLQAQPPSGSTGSRSAAPPSLPR
jgi:tetratricopeptide (TPR) repeat protein